MTSLDRAYRRRLASVSARSTWLRVLAGLLAGAITAAAPFVYYWRAGLAPAPGHGRALLQPPPGAGGGRGAGRRAGGDAGGPGGGWERSWAPLLGAVAAGFYFGKGGDVPQELWLQTLLSLCFAALAALAGGSGRTPRLGRVSSSGWRAERGRGARVGLPWRVGTGLMAAAAVVFGVLAAVAGTR